MAATISKQKLSNILGCSSCKERLTAPVLVCLSGHPVCRRCKNELRLSGCCLCQSTFAESTNPVMNEIIQSTSYSCKYSHRGCKAHMIYEKIVKHEKKDCKHRDITCILGNPQCETEVELSAYADHIRLIHQNEIINFEQDEGYSCTYKPPRKYVSNVVTSTNILQDAANNLFIELLRYNPSTKNLHVMYHYVGRPSTARKFYFAITLESNDEKTALKYTCPCAPLSSLLQHSEDKNCLILNLNFAKRYGNGKNVPYRFEIAKLGGITWRGENSR